MKNLITLFTFLFTCITLNSCSYTPTKSKGGDSVMNYKPNTVSPMDTLNPTTDSTLELDTLK